MSQRNLGMHRPTIGVIAAILLTATAALYFSDSPESQAWQSATLRIGLVMATLWLALPQLQRTPNWLAKGLLLIFMALACIGGKVRVAALAATIYAAVVYLLPMLRKSPEK